MDIAEQIQARLSRAPVIPLIQSNDPGEAIRTTRALVDGGLSIVEVVLRTPAAIECIKEVAQAIPDAIVGAGTVLAEDQVEDVILAGAGFVVLPGLYSPVIRVAQAAELPVFPGVATATETQHAWNLGLKTVKFFPASLAGGPAMIRALSAVFGGLSFMPTGGVSAANLAEYLALPSVLACGGSWLTPADEIAAGNFDAVTKLASAAVATANRVRS